MNEQRFAELLDELDTLAKKQGISAIKATATANANNYADEQIKYGTANGKTHDELVLVSLERQIHSLKSRSE